jgi:hypothetical protein
MSCNPACPLCDNWLWADSPAAMAKHCRDKHHGKIASEQLELFNALTFPITSRATARSTSRPFGLCGQCNDIWPSKTIHNHVQRCSFQRSNSQVPIPPTESDPGTQAASHQSAPVDPLNDRSIQVHDCPYTILIMETQQRYPNLNISAFVRRNRPVCDWLGDHDEIQGHMELTGCNAYLNALTDYINANIPIPQNAMNIHELNDLCSENAQIPLSHSGNENRALINTSENLNINIANAELDPNLIGIADKVEDNNLSRSQSPIAAVDGNVQNADLFVIGSYINAAANCVMCTEPLDSGKYIKLSNCAHEFHEECILKQYNITRDNLCAVCRTRFYNTISNSDGTKTTCTDREQPVSNMYAEMLSEHELALARREQEEATQRKVAELLVSPIRAVLQMAKPHQTSAMRLEKRNLSRSMRAEGKQREEKLSEPNVPRAQPPIPGPYSYSQVVQRALSFANPLAHADANSLDIHNPQINSSIQQDTTKASQIANHGYLLTKLPPLSYPHWINNCRIVFLKYIQAVAENNIQAKELCIEQLLLLPKQVLSSVGMRFGNLKQIKSSSDKLNDRMRDNALRLSADQQQVEHEDLSSEGTTMYETSENGESEYSTSCTLNSNRTGSVYVPRASSNGNSNSKEDPQMVRNIKKAKAQIELGYIKRAATALVQDSTYVNLDDPVRFQQLLNVHPIPAPDSIDYYTNLPKCPSNTPKIIVDQNNSLVHCINELDTGAAGGPSGWTGALAKVLTTDDVCMRGIAALLTDMINGDIPQQSRQLLLASRLIAFDKSNGASLRPIAIGEYFYRLASHRQIKQVANDLAEIFLPIQLGVKIPGGCETIIHTLQNALENTHNSNGQQLSAIAIDFKNAFNSVSRHAVLEQLYSHASLQPLYKLVDFAYSQPSPLFVQSNDRTSKCRLFSQQGVKQGCPLSSLLFALAVHPIYKTAMDSQGNHGDGTKSTLLAIQDDATALGPAATNIAMYNTIKITAKSINLEVQPSKCKFIYFGDEKQLDNETKQFLDENKMIYESTGSVLLGAPIANTPQQVDALALKLIKQHDQFFKCLQSDMMTTQESMLLLRVCGIPRMNYLARTCRPSALVNTKQHFDDAVKKTALKKLDLKALPAAQKQAALDQLALPIKHGGAGLTKMSTIQPAAYISSLAQAHEFQSRSPDNSHSIGSNMSIQLVQELDNHTIPHLKETIPIAQAKLLLPSSGAQFKMFGLYNKAPNASVLTFQTSSLQHKFTYAQNQLSFNKLVAQARNNRVSVEASNVNANSAKKSIKLHKDPSLARLQAITARGAGDWIRTVPTLPSHILSDGHYQLAMKMRLGLPPNPIMPTTCAACNANMSADEWHYLSCPARMKNELNMRHDSANHYLNEYAKLAGMVTRMEPSGLSEDSRLRPDLQLYMDQINQLVDVTIVHPTCPSHLHVAAKQLQTAENAATQKKKKYAQMCENIGANFIPFAIESYGGYSRDALSLIEQIGVFASTHLSAWSKREIMTNLTAAIAISVQRHNAHAALAGYRTQARAA